MDSRDKGPGWRSVAIIVFWLVVRCNAGSCPGALPSPPLTCAQQRDIVDKHNSLRQEVALGKVTGQSSAVDMTQMFVDLNRGRQIATFNGAVGAGTQIKTVRVNELRAGYDRLRVSAIKLLGDTYIYKKKLKTWDKELAKVAQAWADRCVYEHTPKRRLARFSYGQNLGLEVYSLKPASINDVLDFSTIVQMWFDEVKQYGYNNKYDSKTGHYSQVIWADSHLVGCGYSYYEVDKGYNIFYVCNYGPAGNVIGQPAYKKGQPSCARHNLTPSKTFRGLCLQHSYCSRSRLKMAPERRNVFYQNKKQETTEIVVKGDNTSPCS